MRGPRQPGSRSPSLYAQASCRQGLSKIAFSEVSAAATAASISPLPPLASALAHMSATMYCVCDWAVFLLGCAGQPGHLPGATTSSKAFSLGSAAKTGSLWNASNGPALEPLGTVVHFRYWSLPI